MTDPVETLLALYKEQTDQARHHEDQRATISNYALLLAGAVLGLINADALRSAQLPLGCFLVITGCFGSFVTAKHYERSRYHARVARGYRLRIEALQPDTAVQRESIREEQRREFPFLNKERLWTLWVSLHILVGVLGALLAVLALRRDS